MTQLSSRAYAQQVAEEQYTAELRDAAARFREDLAIAEIRYGTARTAAYQAYAVRVRQIDRTYPKETAHA